MRIIIFANGLIEDPAAETAHWVRPGDKVITADGGTRHALDAGIKPAHVIGDLDSLPPEVRGSLEAQGTLFHPHPPAKDETDLELALLWASDPPWQDVKEIVVLGALGGRPDQELANLLLLALPALAGKRVTIADAAWRICLIRGGERLHIHGQPGETLSLIPLGGNAEGITTENLVYPLKDETLRFGPARGVSNVLQGTEAWVRLEKGLLWCFHRRGVEKNAL